MCPARNGQKEEKREGCYCDDLEALSILLSGRFLSLRVSFFVPTQKQTRLFFSRSALKRRNDAPEETHS